MRRLHRIYMVHVRDIYGSRTAYIWFAHRIYPVQEPYISRLSTVYQCVMTELYAKNRVRVTSTLTLPSRLPSPIQTPMNKGIQEKK